MKISKMQLEKKLGLVIFGKNSFKNNLGKHFTL